MVRAVGVRVASGEDECETKRASEFTCLFTCLFTGIDGIKIKIFSTSMDTKGREELLGMQSCQSYQGCPVCLHTWTPGKVVGRRQVVCDGYRCFLHPDSAARQQTFEYEGENYEYRSVRVRYYPCSWYIYLLGLQEHRKAASSCEARRCIRTKGG